MSLIVENPGLLSTIQDLGRFGFQKEGVVAGGAMDALALRIGNLLVGNEEGAPGVEITMLGPELRFGLGHLIALTGADLSPRINGQVVPMWRPVWVEEGSLLEFGRPKTGKFAYIAVAGGFDLPRVMNSYSTYLRAGFGGLIGRALQKGDTIPCVGPSGKLKKMVNGFGKKEKTWKSPHWGAAQFVFSSYGSSSLVKVLPGPEYEEFSEESKKQIWEKEFIITPQSDRMGFRLQGPSLSLKDKKDMLSTAVTFGTIQVPPGGQAVILGADRQTIGGYPRIAQIITADLPKLAQVPPGKSIRFQEVSLQEARQLLFRQEKNLEQLKSTVNFKIG